MNPHRLILASQSPRRRQLLAEAGYAFRVMVPDASAECGLCSGEGPAAVVAELAHRKAADVRRRTRHGTIIACDTLVECGGETLGKPADLDHARRMLHCLRGREHRVYSGLCLWPESDSGLEDPSPTVRVAVTRLRMDPISDPAIEQYLEGGAWEGKAGGFGYQDRLGWVHVVEGSESNVVGLPLELLEEMLAGSDRRTKDEG